MLPRPLLILALLAALAALPASASAANSLDDLPDGFSTVTQARGLTYPTAVAYLPDGTLLIAEKGGTVRMVDPQGHLKSAPLIDISDHVATYEDRGLLGLAVDSDFASNGFVYLLYTYATSANDSSAPKTSRLTRIHVLPGGGLADPSTPEAVLLGSYAGTPCPAPGNAIDCIPSDGTSHSIGTVRSAPDGSLYLGSGDSSSYSTRDPQALRTFDERTMSGKILHVDRDGHGLPGHAFCPADGDLTHVCTKLYAKGFRNPFRFYLRPGGGLVAGDVGWNSTEELDLVEPGRSYGWPCYEGTPMTSSYQDLDQCQAQYALTHYPPAYEYAHGGDGAAVQAGPQYTGDSYPAAYRGSWFFGDYSVGFVKLFDLDSTGHIVNVRDFASGYHGVDFELAPNGDLVYVDIAGGKVERVVYGNRAPVPRPTASPARGAAPLTTTLDGSESVDPDGDAIDSYEWDFESDGVVDATGESVEHTYQQGARTATLTLEDARGLRSSGTVLVIAGETPPTATIEQPSGDGTFRHGTPVTLRGSGTDAEDGVLPGSALHWSITIHHGAHTHVAIADQTGRELTFTPPGDHDADSYYEVALTARDSASLEDTKTVKLRPETVALTLESSPPGAVLSYSGLDHTAPAVLRTAIGYRTSVSAPGELRRGDATYRFTGWSDGGERSHDVQVAESDSVLTAEYRAAALSALPVSSPLQAPSAAPRSSSPAARLALSRRTRAGTRELRGRLTGAARAPRVELALRTRGTRCRRWRASIGGFGNVTRCDRTVWMRARLERSGPSAYRWRLALRGTLPRGSYLVAMRARDARGNPVVPASPVVLRVR